MSFFPNPSPSEVNNAITAARDNSYPPRCIANANDIDATAFPLGENRSDLKEVLLLPDEVGVVIFMVDPSFSVLLIGEWSSDVDDDADPVLFLIILLLSTQNVLRYPNIMKGETLVWYARRG